MLILALSFSHSFTFFNLTIEHALLSTFLFYCSRKTYITCPFVSPELFENKKTITCISFNTIGAISVCAATDASTVGCLCVYSCLWWAPLICRRCHVCTYKGLLWLTEWHQPLELCSSWTPTGAKFAHKRHLFLYTCLFHLWSRRYLNLTADMATPHALC